jgi:acetyltransferase-like isoleucine patch superfamily enzyme
MAAMTDAALLPNTQLRAHLRRTTGHRLRQAWHGFRGVQLGRNVFIDRSVELLRYPQHISIGDDVVVKAGAHLCPCRSDARVKVGARTTIGFYTLIYASSLIEIGSDCMIAPFVYLVDSDHGMQRGVPMNQQSNVAVPIRIGSDVWIGAHSVILKGVTIGDGAVVAAGAVVREDVAPNTIVGGVPARMLAVRS